MRLLYQALLTAILNVFILAGTAQADCCNAGFSNYHLPQSYGLNAFQFEMNDSATADIQFAQWGFGDGTYSNEKNPKHSFLYAGDYSVTLTVFKIMVDGVQKSCSETRVVSVKSSCSDFIFFKNGRQVSFKQIATFDIDSTSSWASQRTFFWTFGDGQTSNTLNPIHTYAQEGNYTACLYQYRKDSAFVDSCYVCHTIVVQDTANTVICRSDFTYAVTDTLVSLYAYSNTGTSSWWIQGDTTSYVYGNNASIRVPSNGPLTICHRQYTWSGSSSSSQYCDECAIIRNVPPVDTLSESCHSDFTYSLIGDSVVVLDAADSAYISYWWFKVNGIDQGGIYYGGDTTMVLPSDGEITVCHLQYNNIYGSANSDSCVVCNVVRHAQNTIPCYSNFEYTVIGNTVSVYIDSTNYGRHRWDFANESVRYDTSITSYTFNTPGIKRICQTTLNTNYSTNVTDSCTTCKDVLIEAANVSIHPNPAVHNVNIKVKDGLLSSITIYNANGIEVKSITDLSTEKCIVNIAALPSGMYYAAIVLTDGRITRSTIIIQ